MSYHFWPGALVRQTVPYLIDGKVVVPRGATGIVIDAGDWDRHSHDMTIVGERQQRSEPRGVLVRFRAHDVDVQPQELELVLGGRELGPEGDGAMADWVLDRIRQRGGSITTVDNVLPRGFPAVARVLHPWQRYRYEKQSWEPATWAEFAAAYGGVLHPQVQAEAITSPAQWRADGFGDPERGYISRTIAAALVARLLDATQTPTEALFAIWEGWGDNSASARPGAALIRSDKTHNSRLFRGPVSAALSSLGAGSDEGVGRLGAQLWWPLDRAWVVASDIDCAWTYVCGEATVVGEIVAHPLLEAFRSSYDHRLDVYGDSLNSWQTGPDSSGTS